MSIQTHIKAKRSHVFFLKLFLGIIVLLFVVMIGLKVASKMLIGKMIAGMPEKTTPVTAITVVPTTWIPVIETTGLVRPNQGAVLSAQAPGTVANIFIQSGQPVKKGDVLVELDISVEQANLQASEAKLTTAKQIYKRYLNLYKTKSVSQQELDNAKANYESLVANINALKAAIERRKIVAPFDGITGIVKVNVGQYVNVGTPIVRVEDTSSMKVDFSIAQNELEKLFIGQKVTATSDARLGETFGAKITALEPAVNAATGLIDVQATFEDEDSRKLLSGMFMRLRVALTTEKDQIVIPQVGISYNMYGESAYVLTALSEEDKKILLDNEKFAYKDSIDRVYRVKQTTVFTKERQGIYAQLKGQDIKPGDQIVVGGQQAITNGSLVVVVDKETIGTKQPAKKTNL
ncbi:efflux transporter periplasmic adaptor subunit [Histophilus somni]|uniref:Efflux RND transporter periplasmic adaptor subunit n=1 Tax=Histophilus somni TaxID=731 RepID=A0A9Q6YZD4_HISSO|nr:efflux RND transporter periplasmic adaptor subunit [Histophilus somni]ARU65206.1 efflux transporter periplasmic adaptor subunit [Histophilus somni]ARU67070.1 efflux transporter periplasmic adaptor subunit [Histophilus somni]ARU68947.1 efflux transporter periplasmic adaptor subunit [Histophilus somni]ARU70826.1 efflux transporter periplasmic adaptor subunit [Histophilus somni]ARU72698.1 efflux transporter periplasmic adaptor subunit [Histophilus somni]